MTKPKLIGIVGHKGAGKTTTIRAACVPASWYGSIHHMGFSDPFKQMLLGIGITAELYDDKSRWDEPLDILCGKTLRHATKTLGTEWGRNCIGPEFWVNIAFRTAKDRMRQGQHVIIDNVRFLSEFEAVETAGGTLIAFHRPGLEVDLSHSSEASIPELQSYCHHRFEHREPFGKSNLKFADLLKEILTA